MKDLETLKITNPEGKEMEIKVITILKKPDNSKSFSHSNKRRIRKNSM